MYIEIGAGQRSYQQNDGPLESTRTRDHEPSGVLLNRPAKCTIIGPEGTRRRGNMRTVLLCFALIAGRALAQDVPARNAPEKAVSDIRDVQLGMSRDHV